ncbi:hypothetical protein CYMTET_39272 [Cymbomonas tetramitiformis]|uniref:Uncharacterized protein n=1 Tax=Cymbomonas tetramitiformis TaxID=36881 RepID=A0AAE0F437_9CHLO|nr:hypothetical protein CYMTET_39272 [Cymbomonas tetramitiformis]
MAKKRQTLDNRRQSSLATFGVKVGGNASAVNADPAVNRPEPTVQRTTEEKLRIFLEKALHRASERTGSPSDTRLY